MQAFVVKQSPKRSIVIAILAFLLMAAAIWMMTSVSSDSSNAVERLIANPVVRYGVMGIAAAFFGIAGIVYLVRAGRAGDLLIVDERGITDNSPMTGVGLIPWSNIRNIYPANMPGGMVMQIDVFDEAQLRANTPKKSRLTNAANSGLGYTGVMVNLSAAALPAEHVMQRTQELWHSHQSSNS